MRILYILPYMPIPANSGNKNLTYNLLKFANKEFVIDLMIIDSFCDNETINKLIKKDFPEIKNIFFYKKNSSIKLFLYKLFFFLRGLPPVLGNYFSFNVSHWLKKNQVFYDLIHFDMWYGSPYTEVLKNKPTVLVSSDAYSLAADLANKETKQILRKIYLNIYKYFFLTLEKYYYPKFDSIICVANKDSCYLANKNKLKNISTIGIPIDEKLENKYITHFHQIKSNPDKVKILIVGNISHNLISARIYSYLVNVYPHIKEKYPRLETVILGQKPRNYLLEKIDQLKNVIHIDFAENYYDFLDQDWIYIYPLNVATGLQTKLQQALAIGLPVIANRICLGGLNLTNNVNVLESNNDKDTIRHITELVEVPSKRINLGKSARDHICENFCISNIGEKYRKMYLRTLRSKNN
tara:strand:+ start:14975 stop:16201 length:1227 start_codon:yes stop_codon:yes gene_type:complete